MATVVIGENPKMNAGTFEQVMQKLRQSGEFPPAGLIFQAAGPTESGWDVITIWNSRDDFERFASERLTAAWKEFGITRDDVKFTIFEAHTVVAGDLSAVPQPAMSGARG